MHLIETAKRRSEERKATWSASLAGSISIQGSNAYAFRSRLSINTFSAAATSGLMPVEEKCFDLVPTAARGSVLDIGVGGGRTIRPLLQMFRDYTGIDYSEPLIASAKRTFYNADLHVADARDLRTDRKFDCIFFSYNGIDYVSYEDRAKIRRWISESLHPQGYFIYSTHNLGYHRAQMWLTKLWVPELFSPRSNVRFLPMRLVNFWRQAKDLRRLFAYVNDAAVGFRLLTVYVDIRNELELLGGEGFKVLATVGERNQKAGYDADDGWVYIISQAA